MMWFDDELEVFKCGYAWSRVREKENVSILVV
jgi:hypothetical protein